MAKSAKLPPELESQPFLDSLPELDTPLAARRLRDRLRALARTEGEPGVRFAALKALGNRIAAVSTSLAGRHITLSLPFSADTLEELETIRELHQAHARAWMSIVRDIPDKGARPQPRRVRELQGKARGGALRALTEVLLSSCRYYRDAPEGLWRDIHQAYWCGVYPDAVGKSKHPEESEADALYTRALLLGLCGAEQLPYRTIDQVATALEGDWTTASLIKPQASVAEPGRRNGRFLIDPASDRPATPCMPGIRPRASDQILDTDALVAQLRQRFESLAHILTRATDAGRLPPDFGELEMLRTLIAKWGGGTLRKQARTATAASGNLLGGLSRVYQALAAADEESRTEIVLSASQLPGNPFLQATSPTAGAARWMQISLEDRSEEGLRIRMRRQTGAYLTVGDLVCTEASERSAGAKIGVIVRARALAADQVEFGIRRLGVAKDTARLHLVGRENSPGDIENLGAPFRALVLERTDTRPELIVADKGLYRPQSTLFASWGGETRVLHTEALFLSTRNFDAFTYSSTASAGQTGGLFAKPVKRRSGAGGDQEAIV